MTNNNELNPPGGTTANITDNLNLKLQPEPPMKPIHSDNSPDENRVPLKQAADHFKCYHGTLKNNVKNGNLPAVQKDPKSPYLVRLSDVEKLLRATPAIDSNLHPREPLADESNVAATPESGPASPHGTELPCGVESAAPAATSAQQNAAAARVASCPSNVPIARSSGDCPDAAFLTAELIVSEKAGDLKTISSVSEDSAASSSDGGQKKRRRRNRGRGKSNALSQDSATATLSSLKSLAGTTPQERLKFMACLSEFFAQVASA
ncbi:MAG: hypothetical protein ACRDBP_05225 [Luteolibacter sp.]